MMCALMSWASADLYQLVTSEFSRVFHSNIIQHEFDIRLLEVRHLSQIMVVEEDESQGSVLKDFIDRQESDASEIAERDKKLSEQEAKILELERMVSEMGIGQTSVETGAKRRRI